MTSNGFNSFFMKNILYDQDHDDKIFVDCFLLIEDELTFYENKAEIDKADENDDNCCW
jgi:hypothetical protein